MKTFWQDLKKPIFVLAPMEDVTDTVFRRIVASCGRPDVFFTEFTSVDGLFSEGYDYVSKRLKHTPEEYPLIAQIWGAKPENYYKAGKLLVEMGFSGIDINMGCPVKDVVKLGVCSALIKNKPLAKEIIQATKRGAGSLPVSVKTRLGFSDVELGWHEFLLQQDVAMLTIHGRTRKQMSKVPADWDKIGEVRHLRDQIAPDTLIVGNGDVQSRSQGIELATQHGLDGVMIGRGVFHDPYVFAQDSSWITVSPEQKIALYRRHVELFAQTWQAGERKIHTLNKFCKIYISDFDGAKELREQLMDATTTDELIALLQ